MVDTNSDAIFFATGNPNNANSSSSLYSDSVISLNATTGSLIWYNQVHQDDMLDRDFGSTPNLFSLNINGRYSMSSVRDPRMDTTIFSIEQTGLSFQRFMQVRLLVWLASWAKARIWKFSFLGRTAQGAGDTSSNFTCPGCGVLSAYFPENKSIAWTLQTGDIVGSVAWLME